MEFKICHSPERESKEKIEKELLNLENAFQSFQHKITFEHGTTLNNLLGDDYCQTVNQELQATLEHLKEIIDDVHAKLDIAIKQYEDSEKAALAVHSHDSKLVKPARDTRVSALSYPSMKDLGEDVWGELKKELVTPVTFVDALDNKPQKEPPALPPKRRRKKPLKYEPPRKIRYQLANRSAYMDARNHPPKNLPNES